MDVNYELYKVFYFVATTLSFSETSKLLFISQSAVSQSIKAFGEETGPDFVHPQHQKGTPDPEGDPASSCGAGDEPIKREAQLMETIP